MQFMLLIYETPDDFGMRSDEQPTELIGAWRAYYRALIDAGCMSAARRSKHRPRVLRFASTAGSAVCRTGRTPTRRSSSAGSWISRAAVAR